MDLKMKTASSEMAQNPIEITLPDGNKLSFEGQVTGYDVAKQIGEGLAKAALAVKIDGEMVDLHRDALLVFDDISDDTDGVIFKAGCNSSASRL